MTGVVGVAHPPRQPMDYALEITMMRVVRKAGQGVVSVSYTHLAIDLYLACGKLGIILAPLSQRLKKPELDDLLARLQPGVLVYEHAFAELVSSLAVPASIRAVTDIDDDKNIFENIILKTDPRAVNVPLAMNDVCLYVHTGGTTAVPKICIVSHLSLIHI